MIPGTKLTQKQQRASEIGGTMEIGQWTPSGNCISSPCPGTVFDPKITVQLKEKSIPQNG